MNRIDRLFGMLLLLQKKKLVRAEDVAKHYEISVRTVYRDMTALSEMGIPLVAQPGEGYSLLEGYFLPPLIFTPEEATALVLGAQMLAGQATGNLPEQAESAIAKITHILPKNARRRVGELTQIIQFFLSHKSFSLDDPMLLAIRGAIWEKRLLHIN